MEKYDRIVKTIIQNIQIKLEHSKSFIWTACVGAFIGDDVGADIVSDSVCSASQIPKQLLVMLTHSESHLVMHWA